MGIRLTLEPSELVDRYGAVALQMIAIRTTVNIWSMASIESNTLLLARYGIYLRDEQFLLCNVIVDLIASDALEGRISIGDYRFRSKRSGGALGDGDISLLDFATFSPFFN